MNLPKTASKIFAWTGGLGSVLVLVYAMLWGVPSYLKAEVRDLYVAEIQAAGPSQEEKNLMAEMKVVNDRLTRIEITVNDFSARFIAYLERQAERNERSGG